MDALCTGLSVAAAVVLVFGLAFAWAFGVVFALGFLFVVAGLAVQLHLYDVLVVYDDFFN